MGNNKEPLENFKVMPRNILFDCQSLYMRRALFINTIIGITFLNCISCAKDSGINPSASITGKWSILSYSAYQGIGPNNHLVNYTGLAGDYYDFRTDGTLYTKEGTSIDTQSYKLVSNTEIIIAAFGTITNNNFTPNHITTLTHHFATITTDKLLTPGGIIGRTLKLKR
jgi:hypothetical protein